jgi:rod shape-determining protein MreC
LAWYGRRRNREPRVAARAVVVGLGLAMIGVLAVQTSSTVREAIELPRETMDGVSVGTARLTSGVSGVAFGFGRSRADIARIAELEAEVRELTQWRDLAQTMALRMKRYETLLNLIGETEPPAVTARIVTEERGPFSSTRIANAGIAEGVKEGFGAINEHGLVGRVIRVGEHTARILMVTDYNSRIPVRGDKSGDRALLVGDNRSGARIVESETPERIVEGEIWRTSGDDGQLPFGVPVGRAVRDGDDWRIELAAEQGPVDFVRLIPPPDFATPEAAPVLPDSGVAPPAGQAGTATASAPAPAPSRTQ